jgi:hypothetical protein
MQGMLSVLCTDVVFIACGLEIKPRSIVKPDIQISCSHARCKSFFVALPKNLLYVDFMIRKPLSTKIENNLQKDIKKLAIDLERPLNDLLEEAIRDLIKKYEKKRKK